MAIRKNTNPHPLDLNPELQDILSRNGLQGRIMATDQGFLLVVQGHDSPVLSYPVSDKQMRTLTSWGNNTDNKRAYDTLTSLIGNDFYMPRDFVHARNANGRVAMGLHGYRIGTGEYGRPLYASMYNEFQHGWRRRDPSGYSRPVLGWTPRQQDGFHMRRVNGGLYYPSSGAPMTPSRPDGRMKPGELQNGGYGFYWKGSHGAGNDPMQGLPVDVLEQMQTVITPLPVPDRHTDPATRYKDVITSDVYFTYEKLDEVLTTHGIVIDSENKTLTIQSKSVPLDMQYDLTDEELKKLTSNSLKESTMQERLETINGIIGVDFTDAVTMDILNSDKPIDLRLNAERQQELDSLLSVQQQALEQAETAAQRDNVVIEYRGLDPDNREGVVNMNGNDLYYISPEQGWFREGRHGREVCVDDLRVEPSETEGKYRMSAVIDGQVVSHEISQKQYDKFLAIDDYHRMKMFSKIFKEVDIKDRYPVGAGVKVAAGIMAGLTVVGEVGHMLRGPQYMPDMYIERHPGSVYMKPGVDTPQDIAQRAFEAGMNTANIQNDIHRGF